MVSCSALTSFESMVCAVLKSRAPPHVEQNRPLEETCAPHEEQYIRNEILSLVVGERRVAANSSDSINTRYEMRSTCTAVP
jgi:hypothetical protein